MDFSQVVTYIQEQQHNPHVGIPLDFRGDFKKVLPCIDRGDCWIITAQTSTFKSSFTRSRILTSILRYAYENPQVHVKVFKFLLEESKLDYLISLTSYLLYKNYEIEISEDQLHGREEPLSEEILEKIKALQPQLDFFNKTVELIDTVRNPFGIYKPVRDYCKKVGTVYYKDDRSGSLVAPEAMPKPDEHGNYPKYYIPQYYKPHNPNTYIFCFIDHISELEGERDPVTHQVRGKLYDWIDEFKGKYVMTMKNFWRVIPVIVQQQTMTGDTLVLNTKGDTMAEKLSPSLPELGDNKGTARLATHVISLFQPSQYQLNEYRGWKGLKTYGDNFLFLNVLKNRRGKKNVGCGLWVEPVSKYFYQLPPKEDLEGQNEFLKQMGRSEIEPDWKKQLKQTK